MYYFEVCEIGRESVKSVNASTLATLIKELVTKYERNHKSKLQHPRFYIRCKEKLEFSPRKCKKNGDDEGFESDGNEEDSLSGDLSNEDAQSTTSSCCLVDDHVFKSAKPDLIHRSAYGREPTSVVSIIGSIDSANSSGSSDTDELELHSLTPSPVTQSKALLSQKNHSYLYKSKGPEGGQKRQLPKNKREEYPIADVIFCHTEPKFPNIIAWVIKKQPSDSGSRLGATGVENFSKIENCLEVVVVKCKNADNLRELCSNYQEYSKRIKLDNYKSIKRKKPPEQGKKSLSLTPLNDSVDVKVSLSDMKIASSGLIKASELSILTPKIVPSFRTDIKNSVSLNSLIRASTQNASVEIKSTGTRTLPPSMKKTQSLLNISKTWNVGEGTNGSGSEKDAVHEGGQDQFNLVQRTDVNGVTHLEITKNKENKFVPLDRYPSKSKLRKEIEGVILTDVESYAKKEQVRQRHGEDESGGDGKEQTYDCPPIRPERRKYLKKKGAAPSPPVSTTQIIQQKINSAHLPSKRDNKPQADSFFLNLHEPSGKRDAGPKGLKGPLIDLQSWRNQNLWESSTGAWRPEPRGRLASKHEEKYGDRKRSTSAGRAFAKKAPMAYRYVYVAGDYREGGGGRRGLPSKIREVGGNLTQSLQNIRHRNSFDDIIGFTNTNKSNLKSVIKKNKKINDKYCEPKKVTFSAFATVQVVD